MLSCPKKGYIIIKIPSSAKMAAELPEEDLFTIYRWIDGIQFSRKRQNISRDFSDGVLCAELIAHFMPKLVDLHNYPPANKTAQKRVNWETLNRKVLTKLGFVICGQTINMLCSAQPGVIEQVLWDLKLKLEETGGLKSFYPSISTSPRCSTPRIALAPDQNGNLPTHHEVPRKTPPTPMKTPEPRSVTLVQTPPISAQKPSENVEKARKIVEARTPKPNNWSEPSTPTPRIIPHSSPSEEYLQNEFKQVNSEDEMESISDMINMNVPAKLIYNQRKINKYLQEKEKHLQFLEGEIANLNMQVRRYKTLAYVKDRRIEDLSHQIAKLQRDLQGAPSAESLLANNN